MTGIEAGAAERKRQIEAEGWSPERDIALYPNGELASAAACYAINPWDRFMSDDTDSLPQFWPWGYEWWKPSDNRKRELEKGMALLAAEWDRIDAVLGQDDAP